MSPQEKKEAIETLKLQIKDIENSIALLKLDLKHAQAKVELFEKQDEKK